MAPLRILVVLLAALLASSCRATMREALDGKAEGTAVVYPTPPEKAWSIARSVVYNAARFDVVSNREKTMITCDAGTGTDTTFIAVWIDPGVDASESVVTIRSVKRGVGQIASVLTEDEFHAKFRDRLTGTPGK